MLGDLYCHERAAAFERRVRDLRARGPEPEIRPLVTPAALEARDILAAVFPEGRAS